MWIVRALGIAVTALVLMPVLAGAHDLHDAMVAGPASSPRMDGGPGPSLAALRARTRHHHVGGRPVYRLANGCYTLRSRLQSASVVKQGDGSYRATAADAKDAERFRLRATALGKYLLYGEKPDFLAIASDRTIKSADDPSDDADWEVALNGRRGYEIYSRSADKVLAVDPDSGELVLADAASAGRAARFSFVRARGCQRYPEATVNATGRPFRGTNGKGQVVGYLEAHQHLMFFEAFGGEFHCGRPWHRFGVQFALPDCKDIEGPRGANAPVQNFLNYGDPSHLHDTVGWPTFHDWPGPDKLTYDGLYWKWLERAWRGGLRTYVALNTDNKALCDVYTASHPVPAPRHDCNEMNSVRIQIADVYALQDYIDAQYRGPGRGWFRIVKSARQARRVIERGKLAVILGIETSAPLDCTVFNQVPRCSEHQIDVELQRIYDMGVRQMLLINKFDNGFGGVAGDSGETGIIVNQGNFKETGRWWDMRSCNRPGHDQPQAVGIPHTDIGLAFDALKDQFGGVAPPASGPPPHCNHLGLSPLGAYMIERMIGRGMIVDPDHLSVIARDAALTLLEHERYPGVLSSHSWADVEAYPRIHKLGGMVTPYAGDSTGFVEAWRYNKKLRRNGEFPAIGYGSDMHGLGAQGPPRHGPNPVQYPFKAGVGNVRFDRQRAGDRVFDINEDGVAQYGMYPDWIEDLRQIAGNEIVHDLSRGSEAYLRMWQHAERRSSSLHTLGQ